MSKSLPCFAALIVATGTFVSTQAVPLTTNLTHLPIPSPNPGVPTNLVNPVYTPVAGGFTGIWSPTTLPQPAQPAWTNLGTFSATGPIPAGTINPDGSTTFDFRGPSGTGVLPVGSIFRFGDVDRSGGGIEQISISGTCAICAFPLVDFLEEPFAVRGTGGNAPTVAEMPGLIVTNGLFGVTSYTIDATNVIHGIGINPNIAVLLTNNMPLSTLTVVRVRNTGSFSLQAPPIPEPASAALIGIGGLLVLARRRNAAE